MSTARFLLTAGASGSGKTLITCGILQALKNRGLKTASFKCGPDYIDPMFHTKVIGTKARNLDTFFTTPDRTRYLLKRNLEDCDIAVMEGVMGYYDGVGGTTTEASAYDLAKVTQTPAVLIVNCKGMSVSILPFIQGFVNFMPDSNIKGVLLNQISPMLYPRVKEMIEAKLGITVYGYVPVVTDCVIESRHLGLVMPGEIQDFKEKLVKLAKRMEETIDFDGLIALGKSAPALSVEKETEEYFQSLKNQGEKIKIGLAMDEAFCFFYEDNLKLLEEMGAELVPFSPIHDKKLPEDIQGLLLYGGYPELYGKALEENASMRKEIKEALSKGMPVLAECGGFMYLHDTFEDEKGIFRQGVGQIKGKVFNTGKLSRFGYIEASCKKPVFGTLIGTCPAHEFHYFDSTNCGTDFHAKKPVGKRGWDCIHSTPIMIAGFPHFYYYGNPDLPKAFLDCCRNFKRRQSGGLEE